jgi:2-polyprenyl-6-methoxyphenol hydroxylase-like FAD-dependent oxidoreductase
VSTERVFGIRGRAKNGSTVTEKSAIGIGADGLHSRLTRTVQASEHSNQAETNRFLGTFNGTVSIPEFFSADNMWRIISGAGSDVPQIAS